jgi:hypothetical protein
VLLRFAAVRPIAKFELERELISTNSLILESVLAIPIRIYERKSPTVRAYVVELNSAIRSPPASRRCSR